MQPNPPGFNANNNVNSNNIMQNAMHNQATQQMNQPSQPQPVSYQSSFIIPQQQQYAIINMPQQQQYRMVNTVPQYFQNNYMGNMAQYGAFMQPSAGAIFIPTAPQQTAPNMAPNMAINTTVGAGYVANMQQQPPSSSTSSLNQGNVA